jgi:hypothetical protein
MLGRLRVWGWARGQAAPVPGQPPAPLAAQGQGPVQGQVPAPFAPAAAPEQASGREPPSSEPVNRTTAEGWWVRAIPSTVAPTGSPLGLPRRYRLQP